MRKKLEHSIRLWLRYDGTLDVTHHKEKKLIRRLCDVERHFKNFIEVGKAIKYMKELRKKIKKSGGKMVDFRFDTFGFQTCNGNWNSHPQNKIQFNKRLKIKREFN